MFNPNRHLIIDLKAQDRLRKWFSQRGSDALVKLQCVSLGDSDIDYQMSIRPNDIRVLNAPYNVEKIKHPLIYSGAYQNLTGELTAYARLVSNNQVSSLYGYPPNSTTYTVGVVPPTLANGFNVSSLSFTVGQGLTGWMVFLQTVPDNFSAINNNGNTVQARLQEGYVYQFSMPTTSLGVTSGIETIQLFNDPNWEMVIDHNNGSFLLAFNDQQLFTDGDFGTFEEPNVLLWNLQTVININLDPTTIGDTTTSPYAGTRSARMQLPVAPDDGSEVFLLSSNQTWQAGTVYYLTARIRLPSAMWTVASGQTISIRPSSLTNFTLQSETVWTEGVDPTATWFEINAEYLCTTNTTTPLSILGSDFQFLTSAGLIEIDSVRIGSTPSLLGTEQITITGAQSGLIKTITL